MTTIIQKVVRFGIDDTLLPEILIMSRASDGVLFTGVPGAVNIGLGGYSFAFDLDSLSLVLASGDAAYVVVDGGPSLDDAIRYAAFTVAQGDAALDVKASAVRTAAIAAQAAAVSAQSAANSAQTVATVAMLAATRAQDYSYRGMVMLEGRRKTHATGEFANQNVTYHPETGEPFQVHSLFDADGTPTAGPDVAERLPTLEIPESVPEEP